MPLQNIVDHLDKLPPIDRSHAGRLRIGLPALAEILHLPKTVEIVANIPFDGQSIELIVEGAGMPLRERDEVAGRVSLLCWVSEDGRTRHLGWEHEAADPSKRWLLRTDPVAQS